jgi:phosphoglycolate phosphatase-like HAD superfamily hydrolase
LLEDGYNTFNYCKPDPRHLTSVIEILDGDIKKSLMIGDSETDANAAKEAGMPVILLEDGYNTFNYCKPDPRHLTSVIEILDGDIKQSLMIGDSETDANAAKEAGMLVILLEDGYTEKKTSEIYHNHLIRDFIGIEKIVLKYL